MKTTEKDFELFKKECEYWIDFFGLTEWEVDILHQNHPKGGKGEAWNWNKPGDQYCQIGLCKDIEHEIYCSFEEIAFHEVCHLLLAKLYWVGSCRYAQLEELGTAEHEVVRRLENSVFKYFNK